jgi:1-acyl-sn-glycerol-3-phosphate acyltransferase
MSTQFALMRERRFLPFFLTQFLGAFNDNFYKNALVVLITFQAARLTEWTPGVLVNVAAGLFILPFVLFSAWAGQLADKYEKSRLIRATKLLEIVVMGLAAVGFATWSLPLLLITLFLMGAQSALFGPVKYAILPQVLRPHELMGGNAMVEAGTFVAILLGTIAGGLLVQVPVGTIWVSVAALAVAALGYLSSWAIPVTPAVAPQLKLDWHPLRPSLQQVREARAQPMLFCVILAISWFWFYGAVFLSQFPGFAAVVLGGDEKLVTLLLAAFSLGIALGSLLCERLSARLVEPGLVPFGLLGLSVFGIDLWWAGASWQGAAAGMQPLRVLLDEPLMWRILLDLVLVAASGGLYIVPLYAMLQHRSELTHRSRTISVLNIISSLFMVVAAAMGAIVLAAGAEVTELFLLTAVLNMVFAVFLFARMPEFLWRALLWMWVRLRVRLKVEGAENVPSQGGALIVANHVSHVDALLIMAGWGRPVTFVLPHAVAQRPLLRGFYRLSGVILLQPEEGVAYSARTVERVAALLEKGECVGVFPEGRVSPDGEVHAFDVGLAALLERISVPVIPVAVRGVWQGDELGARAGQLKGWWRRVELAIAPALSATAVTAGQLQQRIAALRGLKA